MIKFGAGGDFPTFNMQSTTQESDQEMNSRFLLKYSTNSITA